MEIDHVHFYVKNTSQISKWLRENMGFRLITKGNNQHTATEIVGNNSVFLVISSPLNDSSPVADYLNSHPPGVADIAFRVENVDSIVAQANNFGVQVLQFPQIQGDLKWAKIRGWGSVNHTLIENTQSRTFSYLLPAGETLKVLVAQNPEIISIDHLVLNVPVGQLKSATSWYKNIFNFQIQQTFKIKTYRSGLYSEALIDPSRQVQFNINEPTSPTSQIQEFIEINRGSGIQHIALSSTNILQTVTQMRQRGVSFLPIPETYYLNLEQSNNQRATSSLTTQEWQAIKQNKILVDWQKDNSEALLMQIFTQPIFSQPTFFFELIERRKQARGFGEGNFQALFTAIEQQQLKRG